MAKIADRRAESKELVGRDQSGQTGYYKDLREYIRLLEQKAKLVRIKREINKDTELHPLVRWQFRGLPERERKAFLFESVTDVKGRKYGIPVLVAAHAPSTEIYAMAMMTTPEDIMEKWEQAQLHPVKPKIVASGPVQEVVHMGDSLLEHGGLEEFPVPISTPGFDNAPYLSAGNWISKDPDSGVVNIGNYRGMVKSNLRLGLMGGGHHRLNWQKYKARGASAMPAAIVIGPTPNIGLVATARLPRDVSEYDIAGGIAGQPVELVKCKTVDLEVPATAEIVIEGEMPTEYLEVEGPFGEFHGYMGMGAPSIFLNVTCITHRRRPIWNAFISQFPPSESSTLRGIGTDAPVYKFLKHDLNLADIVDVAFHREIGVRPLCVIKMKDPTKISVWAALKGVDAVSSQVKIVIAVDDDIDPRDMDSVMWALGSRMQPDRDILIAPGKSGSQDMPPEEKRKTGRGEESSSSILIDATRKWNYPPVSLPGKEFMERARKIWEEEGLPPLNPKVPWHGYSLGYWTKQDEEEAELALRGEHYKTGEKQARNRTKI
ncbi:MAG: UbiD family decarboxylase [Chloroflexi bacterium]|nr:UbiD family decarboxylase [Chloroflexota bacterium]